MFANGSSNRRLPDGNRAADSASPCRAITPSSLLGRSPGAAASPLHPALSAPVASSTTPQPGRRPARRRRASALACVSHRSLERIGSPGARSLTFMVSPPRTSRTMSSVASGKGRRRRGAFVAPRVFFDPAGQARRGDGLTARPRPSPSAPHGVRRLGRLRARHGGAPAMESRPISPSRPQPIHSSGRINESPKPPLASRAERTEL